MEKKQETPLVEIFLALSEAGQKLLISMATAGSHGMKKDAVSVVSGLVDSELDIAITELMSQKLLEQGSNDSGDFVVGKGERFRLTVGIADKVKSDILKL